MLNELIEILNKYFKAKAKYNAYEGPDKYSCISKNFTKEYIELSKSFFDAEHEIEMTLYRMEGNWQDYIGKTFYLALKTWADIHFIAKENPSRMIHCQDMPGLICDDIMKLNATAEKYLSKLVEIENAKVNENNKQ